MERKKEFLRIMIVTQPFKWENEKLRIAGRELVLKREILFEDLANKDLFKVQWNKMGERLYRAFEDRYWLKKR